MTTTINHDVRSSLGLSLTEYAILDYCAQRAPLMLGTGINIVSESLGLSKAQCTEAMKRLATVTPSLLEKKENGYYYPTKEWYMAHWEKASAVQTSAHQMAADVIAKFNELNGTRYSAHTYQDAIASVLKASPKLTLDHFTSVIMHKAMTWGKDEKMEMYNRPATIFSRKFLVYLDEANIYWLNKAKDANNNELV